MRAVNGMTCLNLSCAPSNIYIKIVSITDRIRLSIALIKINSKTRGLTYRMWQVPLEIHLQPSGAHNCIVSKTN